jgi:cytochrome c oxidase assembly protein Cox11
MADAFAGGIAGQAWPPVVPRHGLGFFARFRCFDLLLRAESLDPAMDSAIPVLQGMDQVLMAL